MAASWNKEKKVTQRKLFSVEEDHILRCLVMQHGDKDFKKIAAFMPGRTVRQVRERYKNYLSPTINNGPWSREEDELLRLKFAEIGPKWSKIASFFPSRSEINIKNRWTSISGRPPALPVVQAPPAPPPAPTFEPSEVHSLFIDDESAIPDLFDRSYLATGETVMDLGQLHW